MRLCCDKENAVRPEGLLLLSTTADNYMHNQFFSCCYMGKFVLSFSLSWSFSNCHCQSVFYTEPMNSTYRALKGSTSRIPLQNSPIHLHLLLHICFHSHRLPLLLLTLTECCLFFSFFIIYKKTNQEKVNFIPKKMSY